MGLSNKKSIPKKTYILNKSDLYEHILSLNFEYSLYKLYYNLNNLILLTIKARKVITLAQ